MNDSFPQKLLMRRDRYELLPMPSDEKVYLSIKIWRSITTNNEINEEIWSTFYCTKYEYKTLLPVTITMPTKWYQQNAVNELEVRPHDWK